MRAHLAKMSLLFEEADTSGDGRLDLEELSICKCHGPWEWKTLSYM